MPNSYFRFKQFTIEQDKCAMKVCTDACILGAMANAKEASTLLDIGTGTGLLALMMAQRFLLLEIDAIEIDSLAKMQATENFNKSSWNKRLTLIEGDIRQFTSTTIKKYDHIICNPPFYDSHLKPEDKANTIARHSEQMTLEELSDAVQKLLSQPGKLSVLLPPGEMKRLEKLLLSKKLFLNKQLFIRDRRELPVIRVIGEFSFDSTPAGSAHLIIKKDKENYTDEFKQLLNDFYLAF